ncbi:hypothetical protein F5878DRAFT_667615 [Lentinula raphanica]|uniref:Ubiquitin-like protease family profile domain-containing protein n=1 Tax=Lentinula raphanica TaxID=153919 RepID=A0AA38NVL8_9AGAR|nr:hypothetical protein F5878DRAFT_667615 [Lentinula raphanica]
MSARRSPNRKVQTGSMDLTIHRRVLKECPPFGYVCSCNREQYLEILTLVRNCRAHLPFLSFRLLSTVASRSHYQNALDQTFPALPFLPDRAYSDFDTQMKRIQNLILQLSLVARIKQIFIGSIGQHRVLPSDNVALIIIANLELLLDNVQSKKSSLELSWWKFLDNNPRKAQNLLNNLMKEIRPCSEEFWKNLRNISFHDFSTLGPGRWLNDEIINYFIDKWCSQSRTTLGFSTFFAGTCLFEDKVTCTVAKPVLTAQDELRVRRSVNRRQQMLNLKAWDSVFIPIHEGSTHWYSARIDFRLKRIDIYDSLQETCIINRQKPVSLRKNTNLMLNLMWLTEILASMRGDTVCLTNNPGCTWICDPHSRVPFQPNAFDCGVHTLWHLKHILEYRSVYSGGQDEVEGFSFSSDMVGKRLRLAMELLQDRKL